jgi:hypothetical protein
LKSRLMALAKIKPRDISYKEATSPIYVIKLMYM